MYSINFIRFKLIFIFFFTIISFPINSNSQETLIEIDDIKNYCENFSKEFLKKKINKIYSVEIDFENDRAWLKNSVKIITSGSNNILRKYKKRFNANIIVNFNENIRCNFKAKIRQHGDKLDHIIYRDGVFRQSMDVELVDGNIFGITKFKLINPESRNRKNELIFISFLEEMGLLAPRTFYTQAKVLDSNNIYIFQEKIVKEFLEHNNYREGPILEGDERFMWTHTSSEKSKKKFLILSRLKNIKWSEKNIENFYTSIDALSILNLLYLSDFKYGEDYKINFSNIELPDNKKVNVNNIFEATMFAARATHGLVGHNRSFYFDPISYEFSPIYYDGEVEFSFDEFNDETVSSSAIIGSLNAIKLINKINIKKIQQKINNQWLYVTTDEVKKIKKILIYNLENISNLQIKKDSYKVSNKDFFSFDKQKFRETNLIFFNRKENVFYKCDVNAQNCKQKSNTKKNRKKFSLVPNIFVGFFNEQSSISFEPEKFMWKNKFLFDQKVEIFTNEGIEIKTENKKIIFNQIKSNGRVLIKDSNLKNIVIHFNGYNSEINTDYNLINPVTGCVTFYKLNISNISFISNNSNCEDSLNIINSKGVINKIEINNSASDALDADFSDLKIDSLSISSAKNDCVDLSYGNYYINSAFAEKCGDKGLSIGENSRYEINNYISNYSEIGIASKDSSQGKVKNLNFGNEVAMCIALYRKKQEFFGSLLNYNSLKCPSENNYISDVSILNLIN